MESELGADFDLALEAYAAGDSERARRLLERALESGRERAAVLDALSTLEFEAGRYQLAEGYLCRLVELFPGQPSYHLNLGEVQRRLGRPAQASASLLRALELKPDFAEAMINLGVLLRQLGEPGPALRMIERALDQTLDFADVQLLYAKLLAEAGEAKLSALHERSALLLRGSEARAGVSLDELWTAARASLRAGDSRSAIAHYHALLAVAPESLQAWLGLGWVLRDLGRAEGALRAARRAHELGVDSTEAALLLTAALVDTWQIAEALSEAERGLSRGGSVADFHFHRGRARLGSGDVPAALASFRHALELDPGHRFAHSNAIFCMSYVSGRCMAEIGVEARGWAARHTRSFAAMAVRPTNERSPERRLRLGYVSEDFRSHPLANFVLPLLEHHDAQGFEVYAYSSVRQPDALTARIRQKCGVFRDVADLSDARLVELIRSDAIDVLVDLALFAGDHRLRVFAARPAPVQLTYLAYLGTSGLSAMGYRLSAAGLDEPASDGEASFSETPLMLEASYWCYDPLDAAAFADDVDATAPPGLRSGHVTFGSQNSFHKLSDECLAHWSRVLLELPDARLVAHAAAAGGQRVLTTLERLGVRSERVTLLPRRPRRAYLEAFRGIDVCLDTLPFNGVTTTLDACWMGTPTLTLIGDTPAGWAGAHLLTQLGLPELVARSPAELVEKARRFSEDLPGLAQLRHGLRRRLQASPLMDHAGFTRDVERLYRRAWHAFCAGHG
jgi:protein O-GlcNAc transferase